jgi:hypothetical protein
LKRAKKTGIVQHSVNRPYCKEELLEVFDTPSIKISRWKLSNRRCKKLAALHIIGPDIYCSLFGRYVTVNHIFVVFVLKCSIIFLKKDYEVVAGSEKNTKKAASSLLKCSTDTTPLFEKIYIQSQPVT